MMDRPRLRSARVIVQRVGALLLGGVLATSIGALPGPWTGSVSAAGQCPLDPTVRQLIGLDRPGGPLSTEFPPIFGSYHERALACYGSRELSLRAFVAAPEGLGGTQPYSIKPRWLTSVSSFLAPADQEVEPGVFEGPWFSVAVPSRVAGLFSKASGRWVQVHGHFDDPAAARCRVDGDQSAPGVPTDSQAVEICRTSFVIDSVRRAAAVPDTSTADVAPPSHALGASEFLIVVFLTCIAIAALSRRRGRSSGRRMQSWAATDQ